MKALRITSRTKPIRKPLKLIARLICPKNGGFCTYGVSVGKKFDGDPEYDTVIDDKLYVFLNREIFDAFNKDRPGTISKAATNWKKNPQHTC